MACKNPTKAPPSLDRAILSLPAGIKTGRILPSDELSPAVEHFWWVQWDTEEEQTSEVLSYPSVHVVFEKQEATVVGIVRKKFIRRLHGRGEVFGIKFRPAMFRQFDGTPAHKITDRTFPLDLFVWDRGVTGKILTCPSMTEKAYHTVAALQLAARATDPQAIHIRDLVEDIRHNSEMRSVSDLIMRSGLTERSLQRLFRDYLGVPPKWVIRRFRLQEASECLAKGQGTIASVAAELGYFDQAHFARDFKSVVGLAPRHFLDKLQATR
ncbi:AraC family transcriptional regulator [Gluconacetobacter sp. Hr-1-5]|uniref:AraC family transcriptional regulator n=1 Tax=Gluconacetobacter sp. Hr-1-5 TaxID=3395370 RepID=UPI003B5274A0